jgi:hypothetical protein
VPVANIGVGKLNKQKYVALVVLLLFSSTVLIAYSGSMEMPIAQDQSSAPVPIDDVNPLKDSATISPELASFITKNDGQLGEGAGHYYIIGAPVSVAFGSGWISYRIQEKADSTRCSLIRIRFDGANEVEPVGVGPLEHGSNIVAFGPVLTWSFRQPMMD